MIKAAASLLVLFAAATAQAGSFGGPPPFTNGSPLPTGDDGVYQASMRGKNLSGVFQFSFSGGAQSSDVNSLYYVFVDGQVYTGEVQVALSTDTISGTMDTSSSVNGITASGYFNGSIDKMSSTAAFNGKGKVTLVDGDNTSSTQKTVDTDLTTTSGGTTTVTTTTTTTSSSTSEPNFAGSYQFKFQGVRTAIPTS